jgi:hypothetical protein
MNKRKGLISVFALAALVLLALFFALGGCGNAIGVLGEIDGGRAGSDSRTLLAASGAPAPVSRIDAGAKELTFVLDRNQEYTGAWKVYAVPEDGVASSAVSASFAVVNDAPTLTLKSESPIAPKTWYVSLTGEGKAESEERLALWGEPDTSDAPMSLAERFRLVGRDGLDDALPGGADRVSAVFNTLHAYLQDPAVHRQALTAAAGYVVPGVALGDWVDLPSLSVAEYKRSDSSAIADAFTASNIAVPNGTLLRLIVVGNNSFHSRETYNLGSAVSPEAKTWNDATPHLVFQFQNIPGTARMQTEGDGGGYTLSGMRSYLVPTEDDPNSGKFLDGLKNAGVPEDRLFAPKRYVTNNGKRYDDDTGDSDLAAGVDEIEDTVWLPTERELFGVPDASNEAYETAANQARLEYYSGADEDEANAKRVKYTGGGNAGSYWGASPGQANPGASNGSFCEVTMDGAASYAPPDQVNGVAPAFCVK